MVCHVCGTRMYARESQIGQTLRCPDCFTDVEVKAPKVGPPPPKKKTLAEMEEFQLSDPGERPAYKPMVEARGEYAELKLLDPKAPPRKEQSAQGAGAPTSIPSPTVDPMMLEALFPPPLAAPRPVHAATAVAYVEDDLDDQEVVLSAPVERIEVKTEVKVPDLPPPQREERKEPGWNDAEWGFIANPRAPGAWKQSPFYIGIFGVFTDPRLLVRVAAYSVGLTVVLSLLGKAAILAQPDSGQQLTAIVTFLTFAILGFLVLISFSPCLLAIAADTANGDDRVQSWPDWNVTDWILSALYIPVAGALAAMPGVIMASMFLAVGAQWFAPFPPLVSFLAIFPILFTSMLTESSLVYLLSGTVLKSLRSHGDGWITFYILSFFFFLFASLGAVLVQVGIEMEGAGLVFMAAIAAVVFVFLAILYFRLLGRLMWFTQSARKKMTEN